MSYNVSIWTNTGFNNENRPYKPTVLGTANLTVPAIEIMQQRFLSSIRVSATWSQVADADFCKIDNMYYVVNSVGMLATDVAELSLTPDFLLSVGGAEAIKVLDGQTERYSEVEVGESDDPLLSPMDAMNINGDWLFDESGNDAMVCECTLSPYRTANDKEAVVYTDATADLEVTVPKAVSPSVDTLYMPLVGSGGVSRGTTLYNLTNRIKDAIGVLRSLGLEGSVIRYVRMPQDKLDITSTEGGTNTDVDYVTSVKGKATTKTIPASVINALSDVTYKNAAHIDRSDFLQYGLLTCAGSKTTFTPKQIDASKGVKCISDPNPDGKPYYRFTEYQGDDSNDGFWLNAASGLQWKNIPMKYTEGSGWAIDKMESDERIELNGFNYYTGRMSDMLTPSSYMGAAAGAQMAAAGFGLPVSQGMVGAAAGMLKAGFQGILELNDTKSLGLNPAYTRLQAANSIDARTAGRNHYMTVPSVVMPYQSEYLRDLHNNGVYVYRLAYTQNDLARIDKLITRYGKKYTAVLQREMLIPDNNKDYVYIQCSGVSVTHYNNGFLGSQWMNDGIAAELEGGIRLWNKKPTATV